MNQETFDPDAKLGTYLLGGTALFLFGVLATILNVALPVEDYQKISNFSVFFFTGGGALLMIIGAPVLAESGSETLRKLWPHLWKILTGAVFASFGALLFDRTEGADYSFLTLLLVAYIILLGLLLAQKELKERLTKTIEMIEVIVVAVALAIFIKAIGVQAFKIPSGSMLPTLQIGDQLLVSKFLYGIPLPYTDARLPSIRDPERGDIVVFAYPGMDNPDKPEEIMYVGKNMIKDDLKGEDFIKRVIGLPGDVVEINGPEIAINGQLLDDKWGRFDPSMGGPLASRRHMGPFKVPEGYYFVMGDNRDHSNDSRFWGFVREGRIKGKAFIIYFSTAGLNRIGTML